MSHYRIHDPEVLDTAAAVVKKKNADKRPCGMISPFRDLILRSLRLPLLYKIVLFNCALTALLALLGVILAIQHVQAFPTDPHYDLVALFLVAGIIVSFLANLLFMRLVLAPVHRLEAAADDASHGKQRRVAPSHISDERLDRLVAAFSGMQNTLDDDAQRMRLLSQQVIYAQEEERERIARELHDEVAQTLTSVLLYLKLLEKSTEPEQANRLQNLRKLITHALNDMRELVVDLHPKILDDWGLEAALGQQVCKLNTDGSRQVTFQVVGRSRERLPRDLELTLFHVAREALNNMVHHSLARCAQVSLRREADWLTLEVQDDGVGFDSGAMGTRRANAFGLASMRDRLALVNGELTIDSQPGRGTRIRARAPMPVLTSGNGVSTPPPGANDEEDQHLAGR